MELNDTELIRAVLQGDVASFEPLITKYQPRVFATARRYARKEDEVADIVQEVFIKAFQKLASFRGEAPFEAITSIEESRAYWWLIKCGARIGGI